jgi:glycosyltransferase involved in cell wall biosynthesis
MVRVLLVADSLDVGGAERVLVGSAIGLREVGHEVEIACSRGGALALTAEAAGVPVWPAQGELVKRRVDRGFAAHVRSVATRRFDLVHTHMFASTAAAVLAGGPAPIVVTEHSEAVWRRPADVRAARTLYRRCARFIAVSSAIADRLTTVDLVPGAWVDIVPNAIPALPASSGGAEVSIAVDSDCPTVGVVARLQPEKGVDVFLRAAAVIAARHPTARFVVVGDGPQRAALQKLTRQLRIADKVVFTGFVADGAAALSQLDIAVVPSRSEGSPLVVLEAMAAGVPIVATRVGGIPDQVRHGREAILEAPDDHAGIAAACLRLLVAPEVAAGLVAHARGRVAQCFPTHAATAAIEQVYAAARGADRRMSARRTLR